VLLLFVQINITESNLKWIPACAGMTHKKREQHKKVGATQKKWKKYKKSVSDIENRALEK